MPLMLLAILLDLSGTSLSTVLGLVMGYCASIPLGVLLLLYYGLQPQEKWAFYLLVLLCTGFLVVVYAYTPKGATEGYIPHAILMAMTLLFRASSDAQDRKNS